MLTLEISLKFFRMFNNYCTQLIDIPKIFIIQACKGTKKGVGVPVQKSGKKLNSLDLISIEVFKT